MPLTIYILKEAEIKAKKNLLIKWPTIMKNKDLSKSDIKEP